MPVTAEVAILNKLGIALAADSAVTISEGANSRKVFNTADKLFELSKTQPIACMVFSNLQFMQTPLQVLIKEFRNSISHCGTVSEASGQLLGYLHEFALKSGNEVQSESVLNNLRTHYEILQKRASDQITRKITDVDFFRDVDNPRKSLNDVIAEAWATAIGVLDRFSNAWDPVELIGEFPNPELLEPIFDPFIPYTHLDASRAIG
jgi:hypothetical protein